MSKPKVIKDYNKLDKAILNQIKLNYPYGFTSKLITFSNPKGKIVSALPFETEDKFYLVRMTEFEALKIMQDDDDFTEDGKLKAEVKEKLQNGLEIDKKAMKAAKKASKKENPKEKDSKKKKKK